MNKTIVGHIGVLSLMLLAVALLTAACGPAAQPTPPESPTAGEPPTVTTQPTEEPPGETPSATAGVETPTSGPSIPATPDPAVGQQIWAEKPCSGCHGANAQGNIGPRLAGTGLTFDQVLLQVRTGKGVMPAFSESSISDLEVRQIYAWLRSLAEPTPTQASSGLPPTDALLSMWQSVNDMKVKSDFAKDLPERQASDDAGRLAILKQYAGDAVALGQAAINHANQALNDIPDEGVRASIRQVINYTNQVIDHGNAALSSNSFNTAWPEAAEMTRVSRLDAWPLATQAVRDVGLTGTIRVRATDPEGNPLSGAFVTALTSHTPVGVRADASGRATIANVAAVPALSVKAYGESLVYHEAHVNVSPGSTTDVDIALPPPGSAGQNPSVADAAVEPSSGAGDSTVTLMITATDPQGLLNLAEDQIFALNPNLGLAYVLRHTSGDQYSTQVVLPGLSSGTHTWYFFAVDHQCNTSNILTADYTVG